MDENKITPEQTPNTNQTTPNTLDLSNFSIPVEQSPIVKWEGIEDIKNPNIEKNIDVFNLDTLNKQNATMSDVWGGLWLDINNLNIIKQTNSDKKQDTKKTNAILSSTEAINAPRKENRSFMTNISIIVRSYVIILFTILGGVWVHMYSSYIDFENQIQPDETQRSTADNIDNIAKTISKYTNIDEYANRANQTDLLTEAADQESSISKIKNNPNLTYTQKRIILQKNISSLSSNIISNQNDLNNVKTEIEKYGFIPKELYDMTKKEDGISDIRSTMALRENVKFLTAFKVFGDMQSFIEAFANDSNLNAQDVELQMRALNNNWEKNIITYTNNCYLNPYEVSDDCSTTNDFNNYYQIIDTKTTIKPDFLKKLASYTDKKLEEKDIPSYSISFPEFNPKNTKIKFTTDLNTNTQDELALSKIWIINPHLFIVTDLINSLKQSLLVVGENIKIDQIKISPKTVRIWSTIFQINNSVMGFDLPIQKPYEREISDYFNTTSSK